MTNDADFDVLSMLRTMDRHIEAMEFESKYKQQYAEHCEKMQANLPEPGSALRQQTKTMPGRVAIEKVRGRRVVRRIMGARRQEFQAKALLSRNERYIKGKVRNVSKSGLFVEADRQVFRENETVNVYIKPLGETKKYRVIATVMRFMDQPGHPKGYGLKFVTASAA